MSIQGKTTNFLFLKFHKDLTNCKIYGWKIYGEKSAQSI